MERTIFNDSLKKNNTVIFSELEEPVVLSKILFDILLKESGYSNLIGLYCFYYYTAKWQRTTQPKATIKYVAKGVGWGEDKVTMVKGRLKELGLIEDIVRRNAHGKITGCFIKLNFPSTSAGVLPVQAIYPGKYYKTNRRKILEKNLIPPSLKLVQEYCSQRKNNINPQNFISFYQSKGWMIGNNKMKDWHAAINTWEIKNKTGNNKFKPSFKHDDNGTKYWLRDDGYYYTQKGTMLIE
jgi:hypothetical protein